ncbi:MAG: TRAP transporter large permease [Gammaproteobacteria bacterium]|nr:TRAP transporter large permease [Gammaproteobacteria bacterium]MYE53358.1 TRAP transporter large permease [Gammaproteobacteria bacterium]MYG12017.1 TRAP transporter large permease [Gammaproteobacteria bacterium]MYH16043.1 TRAP transporter large permease [Gammaproteobacteria bacterium]MYK29968.1 TRAP transporter large permease [Gammaproteobacteria bacterium]
MLILILSFAVFLVIGVPIAYALGLSSLLYFLIEQPSLAVVVPQRVFSGMNNYALISLPLFILMGQVMNSSGITARLIDLSMVVVGRLRGGLGLVNVFSSMVFGGISGSSTSDTASIGSVMIPEMRKRNYSASFASGITVASSTMGMIIPPSVPIVLYAIVAQESVGRLFLGGLIPGLMIGVLQIVIMMTIAQRRQYPRETPASGLGRDFRRLAASAMVLAMPVFVVGAVVLGIATAAESAGLGVLFGLLLGALLIGSKAITALPESLRAAVMMSAKIMTIIAFSQLFVWILILERVPETIAASVIGLDLGPVAVLLLIAGIVLVLGTFIDVSPAILLLTPTLLPAAVAAGVSPVQFGIVLISGLAVGACTPPVGNCLNVCAAISNLGIGEIFRGASPFLLANVMTLILISLFPALVLWVPTAWIG